MKKISKPMHIGKEYSYPILVKVFSERQHLDEFIKGQIFMNTSLFFSAIEKKSKMSEGQYDSLEGTKLLLNTIDDNVTYMDCTSGEFLIGQKKRSELKDNEIEIYSAKLGRGREIENITCMYSFWFDLNSNKITDIDSRMMTEFGEYCAVILNIEEFINRVETAFKELKYESTTGLNYGFVDYVETNKPYVELGTFKKEKKYIYQNEFRISLGLKKEAEPFKFDLQMNLSDIVLIAKTEDILNMKLVNKQLIIGNMEIPIITKL